MAADLDVDVVGREFVRQYYTILNQRPDCLHQFFTQDSSFIHGGVEKPGEERPAYRGQAVIHEKILSLNFCDCHTKIRQVDCQKTIGNAVLVQVSGEFSTNGQPMRRFMQSFVLVQQTPKNFYVHNDIFRYQDEVFNDFIGGPEEAAAAVAVEEDDSLQQVADEKVQVENELKATVDIHQVNDGLTSNIPPSYNVARDMITTQDHPVAPPVAAVVASQAKQQQDMNGNGGKVMADHHGHHLSSNDMLQINGHPDSVVHNNNNETLPEVIEQIIKSEHATPLEVSTVDSTVATAVVATSNAAILEAKADEDKQETGHLQQQQQQQPAAPKVFSWASLASKNTTPSANTTTPPQNKPQATIKPERKTEMVSPQQQHSSMTTNGVATSARQQHVQQSRFSQSSDKKWSESTPPSSAPNNTTTPISTPSNVPEDSTTPGGKTLAFIPDNQQLFIGNLPHAITEQEIKELFEKYGSVIDVKINRKGVSRDLPNFGFVAFDSHDAVVKAMKAKPIMLHGKRRINIEEKKDQSGGSGPRRPPMRGKGGGGGGMMNKSTGGGSGGGGKVGAGSGNTGNFNSHDDDH